MQLSNEVMGYQIEEDPWAGLSFSPKGNVALWINPENNMGLGFTSDLFFWYEIQFTDLVRDAARFVGSFSYHRYYLVTAQKLLESLEENYIVVVSMSGLLFLVGATFFVILTPITGPGRTQGELFLHEILVEGP